MYRLYINYMGKTLILKVFGSYLEAPLYWVLYQMTLFVIYY